MSKISLAPNASGTGNFTIASPNGNTDRTLTLPDNTGTILTSASNTNFPTGSVLQVVQGTYSTQTTTSSSTFSDTGLTASITPSSSSNKILVFVSHAGCLKYNTNTTIGMKIVRNSTDIHVFGGRSGLTDGTVANGIGTMSTVYLDSPSTTSSTTYKTQYNSNNNTGFTLLQDSTAGTVVSTITLVEIKG
jgi:hypothetical protein